MTPSAARTLSMCGYQHPGPSAARCPCGWGGPWDLHNLMAALDPMAAGILAWSCRPAAIGTRRRSRRGHSVERKAERSSAIASNVGDSGKG